MEEVRMLVVRIEIDLIDEEDIEYILLCFELLVAEVGAFISDVVEDEYP
jgi:hypothetical protein